MGKVTVKGDRVMKGRSEAVKRLERESDYEIVIVSESQVAIQDYQITRLPDAGTWNRTQDKKKMRKKQKPKRISNIEITNIQQPKFPKRSHKSKSNWQKPDEIESGAESEGWRGMKMKLGGEYMG